MLQVLDAPSTQTHAVDWVDGKVIVRNVELWSERAIGAGTNSEWDVSPDRAVDILVSNTNDAGRKFSRSPLIVLGHTNEPARATYGRVLLPVRVATVANGSRGIVGDLEFAEADYNLFIASNRFPRRSSEISWRRSEGPETATIDQVALLGGTRDAGELKELVFSSPSSVVSSVWCSEDSEISVPASPVVAPEGTDMTVEDLLKAVLALSDDDRAKLVGMIAGEKEPEAPEVEPEEVRGDNASGEIAALRAVVEQQSAQIRDLSNANRRAEYSAKLSGFVAEGVRVDADAELDRLMRMDSQAATDHLAVIGTCYARSDNAASLLSASRSAAAIAGYARTNSGAAPTMSEIKAVSAKANELMRTDASCRDNWTAAYAKAQEVLGVKVPATISVYG